MTQQDPSLDYFEQYREKKKQLAELTNEHRDLRTILDQKRAEARVLENEISSMKRIITTMIDHGVDHVEAKLMNDPSDLKDSMWDDLVLGNTSDIIETITISDISSSSMSDGFDMLNSGSLSSYPVVNHYPGHHKTTKGC